MSTALELLGHVPMRTGGQGTDTAFTGWYVTTADLELVAERAREEMRDMAAAAAVIYVCVGEACGHGRCNSARDAELRIRALPVRKVKP